MARVDKIQIIPGGNFYHHEFSGYGGADKVHPVIFANLIWTMQVVRNALNDKLVIIDIINAMGLDTDYNTLLKSEIGMRITGFTRTRARTLELKEEQEEEVRKGLREEVTVSDKSTHEIENGGCALDWNAFFTPSKKVIPIKLVVKVISPRKELYDYLLPRFEDDGSYSDPYGDEHAHLDRRNLAVKLGLRK